MEKQLLKYTDSQSSVYADNFGALENPEIFSSVIAKPFSFKNPKTITLDEFKSMSTVPNNQKKILKIIKEKNAISYMPILFDSVVESTVDSELFYECAKKIFDSNGGHFDGKKLKISILTEFCVGYMIKTKKMLLNCVYVCNSWQAMVIMKVLIKYIMNLKDRFLYIK